MAKGVELVSKVPSTAIPIDEDRIAILFQVLGNRIPHLDDVEVYETRRFFYVKGKLSHTKESAPRIYRVSKLALI